MSLSGAHKRRWWFGAIAAVLVASLVPLWLKPRLEAALQARIEATALRHGVLARIGAVRVGIWPVLRLEGVDLALDHGLRFQAERVRVTWPGSLRVAVLGATFTGPAGIKLGAAATTWKATGLFGDALQLTLREPQAGLTLQRRPLADGSAWRIEARELRLGTLLTVQRDGLPLLDGGVADGQLELRSGAESTHFQADLGARGLRVGALAGSAGDDSPLGEPTDLSLRLEGSWQPKSSRIDIPEVRATLAGAALTGSLSLLGLDTDPEVDLVVDLKRLDFAQLMSASGMEMPESLGLPPGSGTDLGAVTIGLQVRGRLADATSFAVTQKIGFTPPRELPSGVTRLRGDFQFRPAAGTGQDRSLDISPASPDFIALRDVPPLFLRTLLLAEDAGFYGHRGIDLREMPAALITNWSRGGAARGASTISQQLAKNLFLSRDKQVGRKLQELAITFLLESALGKERILEIYLNIIEWGPDLRGLRPAARHYFDREPGALTPAQMAFLVSIIPGPILYQRSLAEGAPGPGLRVLIDNLLAKLRSVDAISEAEYQQALADPLSLSP